MTSAAVWPDMSPPESLPDNVRRMSPRPAQGEMFVARVRVLHQTWLDFLAHAGEGERSAWLKDFMEAFNRQPELWKNAKLIADRKGEVMWTAVLGPALSRYIARNKEFLDGVTEDE